MGITYKVLEGGKMKKELFKLFFITMIIIIILSIGMLISSCLCNAGDFKCISSCDKRYIISLVLLMYSLIGGIISGILFLIYKKDRKKVKNEKRNNN